MRRHRTAPVDSMGCERAHDEDAEPQVRRFQCLVSLMLSSQTRDEVNFAAMERLKEHGLTIENLLNTSEEKLGELIKPVGFWRRKAQYLLEVAAVLRDQYGGDIPDSVEGLCKLKGVGVRNDSANLFALLPGGTQDGALVHEQWLGQAIGYWGGCPCAQDKCTTRLDPELQGA